MSLKTITLATAAVLITATSPAHADLFDRINETMDKIDNAVTETENTIDRATGTADRMNEKAPAAGGNDQTDRGASASAPQPNTTSTTAPREIARDNARAAKTRNTVSQPQGEPEALRRRRSR